MRGEKSIWDLKIDEITFQTGVNIIFGSHFTYLLMRWVSTILFTSASELGPQVASCGLPAVHLTEQQLCITGLCSTLRFLISCSQLSQETNQEILGYNSGCLSAPAEVSTWTKFCEVDLPQAVNNFMSDFCCSQ